MADTHIYVCIEAFYIKIIKEYTQWILNVEYNKDFYFKNKIEIKNIKR